MLVWERPKEIGDWVAEHGGGRLAPGSYSAIGWVEKGELTGGLCFYAANGVNCYVSLALSQGRFPRPLLKASLWYLFHQLTLRRVTFLISHGNLRSQNLVTRLGAKREATLCEADSDGGDLYVYSLFPQDCYLWSRFKNGQERRRTSESRSASDDPSPGSGESPDVRLSAPGNADEYAGADWIANLVEDADV